MQGIPLVEYFKPYLKTFVEEAAHESDVTATSVLKEGHEKSKKLLYSLMPDVLEEGSEFRNVEHVEHFLKEVKNGKAILRFTNEIGSDSQDVELTQTADGNYFYRTLGGNNVKKVVGRRLVKIADSMPMKRRALDQ